MNKERDSRSKELESYSQDEFRKEYIYSGMNSTFLYRKTLILVDYLIKKKSNIEHLKDLRRLDTTPVSKEIEEELLEKYRKQIKGGLK